MKILVLAPQPFFQARGTPIATRQLLQVLSSEGHDLHVLTYHEGEEVSIPNCTIQRIPAIPGVRNIPPGFSIKKILCDVVLFASALRLCWRQRWDVVHAIEESVFIAWILKLCFGIRYIYDMDSSLPDQLLDRFRVLSVCEPLFRWSERLVLKSSDGAVVVCPALQDLVETASPSTPVVCVEDASLLGAGDSPESEIERHRRPQVMYVGNLEPYQGIDLLLDAFAILPSRQQAQLVIIGGSDLRIADYQRRCEQLGITDRTQFLGPIPIESLGAALSRADILVSPRISGRNTPMKIYSYLDSGRPVLATRLSTHTQVLDDTMAYLVEPTPEDMSNGLCVLLDDDALRQSLAKRASRHVRDHFQQDVLDEKLALFYEDIEQRLNRLGISVSTNL